MNLEVKNRMINKVNHLSHPKKDRTRCGKDLAYTTDIKKVTCATCLRIDRVFGGKK